MFGLADRERKLYEKIIDIQQEEITTLRLQLGLYQKAPEPAGQEPAKADQYANFHVASDMEEDLEWQLESGRISLDEFEDQMRSYGIPLEPLEPQ